MARLNVTHMGQRAFGSADGYLTGMPCSEGPLLIVWGEVGFFSRLLVPRGVRGAVHPGRAVKRAITPKAVKSARRALHPVDNAMYSMQRSVATSLRSDRKGKARVWRHGNCPVNHRSPEAAARCRNS